MCKIANDWLRRAIESDDPYDKFISAYFALNFLYGGREEVPERDRMAKCLEEIRNLHNIHISPDVYKEYTDKPIKNECPKRHVRNHKASSIKPHKDDWRVEKDNYESLFNAIYQVRCNLFHGNKSIGSERDTNLVKQGADVIIGILSKKLGVAMS